MKYMQGSWFKIFESKFNTVDACHKSILWLNKLIVAKRKQFF